MSNNTKNIITATAAIIKTDDATREAVLLRILESNPSVVVKALMGNGVKFDDLPGTLFKVVMNCSTDNKINLIRAFREARAVGLVDAKAWSEGETVNGCPSGVFGVMMTREAADDLAYQINRASREGWTDIGGRKTNPTTGITVKVVQDDAKFEYRGRVTWNVKP